MTLYTSVLYSFSMQLHEVDILNNLLLVFIYMFL